MKERVYYTYLTTNERQTVIYTGMTNNLSRRMAEHKNGRNPNSFTNQYNVRKLVYYEVYSRPSQAIAREKQLKAGSRKKKLELIKSVNSQFKDLSRVRR